MAGKRVSRTKRANLIPKRKPFIWSITETAALLAWADRCYEQDLSYEFSLDTIVHQLSHKWQERGFSQDLVVARVKRVWNRMGKDDTIDPLGILKEGTHCLDLSYFIDDEAKAFEEARSEIQQTEGEVSSRTRSKASTPRQYPGADPTRSSSATVTLERSNSLVRHTNGHEVLDARIPRAVKRAALQCLTSAPPTKKSRSSSRPLMRSFTEVPDSEDEETLASDHIASKGQLKGQKKYDQVYIDPDMRKLHSMREDDSESFDEFMNVLEEKDLAISKTQSRILALEQSSRQRENDLSALKKQNEQLRQSNTLLTNRLLKASRELQESQTRLKDRKDCQKVAARLPETELRAAIQENEETITDLKRQLYETRRIALPEPQPRISLSEAGRSMKSIEERVKTWSYKSGITFPATLTDVELSSDIVDLLRRSLPSFVETIPISKQLVELAKDVGSPNIQRALTATVLRDWVFETDFYDFDGLESERLTLYRKKLLAQHDGPRLLRNLDHSATESLISTPYFQEHILKDKAEELTTSFLALLHPFLPNQPQKQEINRSRCEEMFRSSLRWKLDLVLTTYRYELRAFEPGTAFSAGGMSAETREGAAIKDVGREAARRVGLCLFPALYAYPCEALPEDDELGEGEMDASSLVVQSINFLQTGEERREGKAMRLSEAVVLLEEQGLTLAERAEIVVK